MFVIDGSKDSTGSGKIFLVVRYYHCYNWWRYITIGLTKGDLNIARLLLLGRPPLNQVIIPQPLPESVSIIIIIIINIINIIIIWSAFPLIRSLFHNPCQSLSLTIIAAWSKPTMPRAASFQSAFQNWRALRSNWIIEECQLHGVLDISCKQDKSCRHFIFSC